MFIPLSPSGVELRQMGRRSACWQSSSRTPPPLRVLLTQVHSRMVASRVARDLLARVEVPLLQSEVPQRQRYRTAFGGFPSPKHHEAVLAEPLRAA